MIYSVNYHNHVIMGKYAVLYFILIRFSPEEKAKRPQLSYLPFGFGPRSCIGMRFALVETKVALIQFLRKYTFVQAPDTEVHVFVTV